MPKKITRSELVALARANSDKLPATINYEGRRMRWVGFTWVNEGPATAKDVLVVEDEPAAKTRSKKAKKPK